MLLLQSFVCSLFMGLYFFFTYSILQWHLSTCQPLTPINVLFIIRILITESWRIANHFMLSKDISD